MTDQFSALQSTIAGSLTIKQSLWLHVFSINMEESILLSNEEMRVTFINEQFCKLFQIKEQPDFFIDKTIMEVFAAVDKSLTNTDALSYKANEAADKKTSQKQEIKLNNDKVIHAFYQPLLIENNFIGHCWIYCDESEAAQSIKKTKEEKYFFEDILNNVSSGISVLSPTGPYLYVNKAEEENGEMRKWMIGKNDLQYFSQTNKEKIAAEKRDYYFKKTLEENIPTEWEESFGESNTEKNSFLRNYIPVYDDSGKIKMIISISKNINKQKDTEAQLQQSEKKFRDLFTYTQAIICTHDMSGILLSANPALCNLLGYTDKEIIGKNIADCLPENERETFENVYLKEINTNKRSEGLFKILRKSGEEIYLLYQNYTVEDSDQLPYVVGFAQDITQRILVEKKLKEAQKQTEEIIKSKERFLATMSHEIRTPMNGIIGISSLLQKTILTGEQKFYLNIIEESAQKLLNSINQIQESSNGIIPHSEQDASEESTSNNNDELMPEVASENITEQTEAPQDVEPKPEIPALSTLGNLYVLLAEDNDINQVLAKNILKQWGFSCKTVSNGEEVLPALEKENFDIILMDIQMPHKSGIEVTKEIRELSDPIKKHTPIIALTAFSIRGEEKKYYEAGMDACLTKPFKEKELYDAISKILKQRKEHLKNDIVAQTESEKEIAPESTEVNTKEKTTEQTSEKLYDLSYLRGIQGSSTDLVNKLIEIFIRTVPPATKEMMHAAKNGDWQSVSKLAHKVKSSINTMGIHSLKNDIKFVEEYAAQKQELEEVANKIETIDNSVIIASKQLQEELNKHYSTVS